ncbi:unnamed protein product [Bursaphelenchus xylophilus]|uniref:(pine wood nematode) hypothetical protein n=1 Tax=Bursaphelenchus xylophilus TaxID=6326 RepID=A0A1I7RVR5_BURXY|nr:unnamed protein product [Bursaphelenchus xylophilus]CAG9082045.1 unnamed protein product [Bursaphelenchus xylophilus]
MGAWDEAELLDYKYEHEIAYEVCHQSSEEELSTRDNDEKDVMQEDESEDDGASTSSDWPPCRWRYKCHGRYIFTVDEDAEKMVEAQERAVRRMIREDELKISKESFPKTRDTAFSWYVRAYHAEREHHLEDGYTLTYDSNWIIRDYIVYIPCENGVRRANRLVRRLARSYSKAMNTIEDRMLRFYESRKPSQEHTNQLNHLLEVLNKQLPPHFEGYSVAPYGGSHNGFGSRLSDMDVTLISPTFQKKLPKVTDVLKILEMSENVAESGLAEVDNLEEKGVPLAKLIFEHGLRTEVDLTVQNFRGVINTKLLAIYSRIDNRAAQLLMTIKKWAKTNQLHGGALRRYNTYTLVILVINFLQKGVYPEILPVLHEMIPDLHCKLKDHSIEEIESQFKWDSSKQEMGLSELLVSFMSYYAMYDFCEWSVDIRCTELKNRNSLMFNEYEDRGCPLSIRCPVEGRCPTRSASAECYADFRKTVNEFNRLIWTELCDRPNHCQEEIIEKVFLTLGI